LILDYLVTIILLRHQNPAVANILTHSVNLAVGPKSGCRNKYRVRACNFRPWSCSGFKTRPVYNSAVDSFQRMMRVIFKFSNFARTILQVLSLVLTFNVFTSSPNEVQLKHTWR